jgi:antitoxin component of MazEF toxin-antitoxin module
MESVRKILKFSDNLGGVSIPRKILTQVNLNLGDPVVLVPTGDSILIKPLRVEVVNPPEGREERKDGETPPTVQV